MTYEEFKTLDKDMDVCICNGVTLGEILTAIENGHDTIEAIMNETDAGTTCEMCQSREIDDGGDREIHLDEILEFAQK